MTNAYFDENGIKTITQNVAQEAGVDISTIKVCKRLRQLAKLDRVRLDESEHRSGLNRHLFDYIKYCGKTPLEYIKRYLSLLQPYMIERRKDQEFRKPFICVIDKMYRISVYIKADSTLGEEIIVSFHEDNKRGVAKTNDLISNNMTDVLVPVFAESFGSVNRINGNASLNLIIQRGMLELPLSVIGIRCEDFFIVRQHDVNIQFIDYCNEYIRDLYTSDLDLDFDQIEVFSMLQQISFTSYGRDTFSSISLLIDSLITQKDQASKRVADFALITFIQSLKLTGEQKDELALLLEEKYKVTSIKNIDDILRRVQDALYIETDTSDYRAIGSNSIL